MLCMLCRCMCRCMCVGRCRCCHSWLIVNDSFDGDSVDWSYINGWTMMMMMIDDGGRWWSKRHKMKRIVCCVRETAKMTKCDLMVVKWSKRETHHKKHRQRLTCHAPCHTYISWYQKWTHSNHAYPFSLIGIFKVKWEVVSRVFACCPCLILGAVEKKIRLILRRNTTTTNNTWFFFFVFGVILEISMGGELGFGKLRRILFLRFFCKWPWRT